MKETEDRIRAFWQWFVDHQPEFRRLSKPDEPFWDVELEQIKQVDGRLWIELSASDAAIREFIVTAEGHVEAFPIVEALVNLAPKIEHWDFKALKPPMGFEFTTQHKGKPSTRAKCGFSHWTVPPTHKTSECVLAFKDSNRWMRPAFTTPFS